MVPGLASHLLPILVFTVNALVEAETDGGGVMLLVCGRVRERERERERGLGMAGSKNRVAELVLRSQLIGARMRSD